MADIAAVFHWSPDTMDAMAVEDLMSWHEKAVTRWNQMNAGGKTK